MTIPLISNMSFHEDSTSYLFCYNYTPKTYLHVCMYFEIIEPKKNVL